MENIAHRTYKLGLSDFILFRSALENYKPILENKMIEAGENKDYRMYDTLKSDLVRLITAQSKNLTTKL